jgi:serine/threonine protein kinase
MPLRDGATFAGFAIVRLLGSGQMGEVYLAQHPRLPRSQALRILPAVLSADATFRARFYREADLAASLSHPHLVRLHDRGEYEGRLWISMGYVEGLTAARLLARHQPGGLPRAEALEIVTAVAAGLDYAHERGLLHLGVDPANILVSDPDSAHRRILLADLGIARQRKGAGEPGGTGTEYTAPEQSLGLPLDGRTDQYALGATARQLLHGAAGTARPGPADLDPALNRALAKEPAERFPRCQDFATALRGDEPTLQHLAPPHAPTEAGPATPAPLSVPIPAQTIAGTQLGSVPGSMPGSMLGSMVPYGAAWPPPFPPPPPGWEPRPPRRRTRRRWVLTGVALVLALVAAGVAVTLLRRDSGGRPIAATSPTTTTTSMPPAASTGDVGPVGLITEEPTCVRWLVISPKWPVDPPIHTAGVSPVNVARNAWTPEQQSVMQTMASNIRAEAGQTAVLANTTPHRVMRELYEQFVAYARAFADAVAGNYVPDDSGLLSSKNHLLSTLTSLCVAVRAGAPGARSALITVRGAPARVAPPQDPGNPQRFVTASDLPACVVLESLTGNYASNPAVTAWIDADETIPASKWDPRHKALNDAVAPIMLTLADDVERATGQGNNPVMADFGMLFAQYERVFVKTLPTYGPSDFQLEAVASSMLYMVAQACHTVGA